MVEEEARSGSEFPGVSYKHKPTDFRSKVTAVLAAKQNASDSLFARLLDRVPEPVHNYRKLTRDPAKKGFTSRVKT